MFSDQTAFTIGQKFLKIILYLVAAQVAQKLISLLVKRLRGAPEKLSQAAHIKHQERVKTITNLVKNTSKIVLNFIVFLMILAELGVDIRPLITGAGILGLAVGFGAKSLVADLIAGFFIILENQFNVGDEVEIGKTTGKGRVTNISLRTITLKDKEGKVFIIPNSSIKYVVKLPKKKE